MLLIDGIDQLRDRVGSDLGTSDWLRIEQEDVDAFAELTDDAQWIHVDVKRAAASQFGGTIVHGYFTLASCVRMARTIFRVQGYRYGLNYGVNKVRFPAPLPTGCRIRMQATLKSVTDVANGGVEVAVVNTVMREGAEKPVCVAETLTLYYF